MLNRRRRLPCTKAAVLHAKELRSNLTVSEAMLWKSLSGRSMRGYDFDRQKPIGDYIVDFYCKALMLAVEIDGDSHRNKEAYDARCQAWLDSQGVRFLRFDDALFREQPQHAVRAIDAWIEREESGA